MNGMVGRLLTNQSSNLPSWTGIKLREANQQQQFNRNVEDIELWLYEVEGHLASDDYGKDLTNVQNLQKKHALLEADVAAHQVRGQQDGSLVWDCKREEGRMAGIEVRDWSWGWNEWLFGNSTQLLRLGCLPLGSPGA